MSRLVSDSPLAGRSRRVLLDTDIGSDVDDSLALALILGSPETELVGITTVYGDTILRARIARQLLSLAGITADIPIVSGAQRTLSGRPVWWPGHEGRTYDLGALEQWTPAEGAAQYLVEQAAQHPGDIDLVAIGPLTNVAEALTLDPRLAANLRSIHLMGASFDESGPEHNVLSDTHAADVVFRSDARLVVTPVDMTRRVRLEPMLVERIEASGPMGSALGAEIRQWMEIQRGEHSIPHDATTALGIVRPDLFEYERSHILVSLTPDDGPAGEGATRRRPDPHSNTDVVVDLDVEAVRQQIVGRVCAADGVGLRNSEAR